MSLRDVTFVSTIGAAMWGFFGFVLFLDPKFETEGFSRPSAVLICLGLMLVFVAVAAITGIIDRIESRKYHELDLKYKTKTEEE